MEETGRKFNFLLNIILVIIVGISLIIASSAFWFNSYLFNTDNFTQVTTSALTSDSSRNALASEIVDRALKDKPVLQNAIEQPATKLVSGLLDSNLAQNIVNKTVGRLHSIMVAKNPQNVEIDLTGLKNLVVGVANLVASSSAGQNLPTINGNNIPDKLVLVDASKIPNFYSYGSTILWIGPLAALLAAVLLLLPIAVNWKNKKHLTWLLLIQGVGIIVFGLLAFALGPLFKPPVLANINSPNLRIVAGNVYDAFLQKFAAQVSVILFIGLIFLALAFINYWFRLRPEKLF